MSTSERKQPHPGLPGLSALLLLLAFVLYALAVRMGVAVNVGLVLAGTVALAVSIALRLASSRSQARSAHLGGRTWESRLLLGVVLLGLFGASGWSSPVIGPPAVGLQRVSGLVWIILALATYLLRQWLPKVIPVMAVSVTLGFTLLTGWLHIAAVEGVGFDVYFLHAEAARALGEGFNPYTEAVRVPDGSPTAEPGAEIVGYVYPPVTALAYAVGEWTLSDARYASLAAWLALLGIIGGAGIRRRTADGIYVMLLLAAIPGIPLLLRASWTEPLSLAMLSGGFFLWRRAGRSGSAIGLALASKQYFLVCAPLFLVVRNSGWKLRLAAASGVVMVAVGGAFLWDASAFWSAAVAFHTTTPPRLDSSNLVGLLGAFGINWRPHTALTLGLGFVVAAAAGRVSHDRTAFFMAMALALASSFLVSSQAFANYWFLIAGITALALHDFAPSPDKPVTAEADKGSS